MGEAAREPLGLDDRAIKVLEERRRLYLELSGDPVAARNELALDVEAMIEGEAFLPVGDLTDRERYRVAAIEHKVLGTVFSVSRGSFSRCGCGGTRTGCNYPDPAEWEVINRRAYDLISFVAGKGEGEVVSHGDLFEAVYGEAIVCRKSDLHKLRVLISKHVKPALENVKMTLEAKTGEGYFLRLI